MGRKYRKTETSDVMMIPQNGQYMHRHVFCINCHGVNKHYPDCQNPEVYDIPSSAEVPTKNSSKRKWDIFKKQFVYPKPEGFWFYIGSWFQSKNNKKHEVRQERIKSILGK